MLSTSCSAKFFCEPAFADVLHKDHLLWFVLCCRTKIPVLNRHRKKPLSIQSRSHFWQQGDEASYFSNTTFRSQIWWFLKKCSWVNFCLLHCTLKICFLKDSSHTSCLLPYRCSTGCGWQAGLGKGCQIRRRQICT